MNEMTILTHVCGSNGPFSLRPALHLTAGCLVLLSKCATKIALRLGKGNRCIR